MITYEIIANIRVVRCKGKPERIGDRGWIIGRYSDGMLKVHFDRDAYPTVVCADAVRSLQKLHSA